MHSHYAVSAEGLPLGLWEVAFLTRGDAHFRARSGARKKRPLSEKESVRWLEGWQHAQALAAALPHREVFALSDREGDIYEIYAAWEAACRAGGAGAQFLIRASQDRAVEHTAAGSPKRLFAALAQAPLLGTVHFEVPAKKQMKKKRGGSRVMTLRRARSVCQEIRAMEVTLRPPSRPGGRPPPVKVWALVAKEIDPPPGEEPLSWVLLTSVPVETLAQAQRLIGYYLRRWDIEVFHRVLKTGCRAEALQLKNGGAVRNALIIHAITAWRILYLTQVARIAPEEPCHLVFASAEWQAACDVAAAGRARDAPPAPSLKEIITIIARFGGHLGRKGDGPPGPQVLWRGLARLRDFTTGRESLQSP
jgi:hypothetical protein